MKKSTKKKPVTTTYAPVAIGTVTLDRGEGVIRDPRIRLESIVLFNVASPDELESGARVVIEEKRDGLLRFSTRIAETNDFTEEEPLVFFAVFDGNAPGVINPIMR